VPQSGRKLVEGKEPDKAFAVTVQGLSTYLGVPKHRHGEMEAAPRVGLCTGMAYTEMGGEILMVRGSHHAGSGKVEITGKLGDVMQESAKAALSYLRSRSPLYGLKSDFHKDIDIHIHVPEGATPKDGPSAGITLATAIISALLNIPVRNDLAMTGEITLRGRVLPIGGLREKSSSPPSGAYSPRRSFRPRTKRISRKCPRPSSRIWRSSRSRPWTRSFPRPWPARIRKGLLPHGRQRGALVRHLAAGRIPGRAPALGRPPLRVARKAGTVLPFRPFAVFTDWGRGYWFDRTGRIGRRGPAMGQGRFGPVVDDTGE
jgi:hypothetical protein